jgi:hypothetical protein
MFFLADYRVPPLEFLSRRSSEATTFSTLAHSLAASLSTMPYGQGLPCFLFTASQACFAPSLAPTGSGEQEAAPLSLSLSLSHAHLHSSIDKPLLRDAQIHTLWI